MHKKIKSPSISVKIGKITAAAAGTANFSIEIQVHAATPYLTGRWCILSPTSIIFCIISSQL